jgi:hypothetical protein
MRAGTRKKKGGLLIGAFHPAGLRTKDSRGKGSMNEKED